MSKKIAVFPGSFDPFTIGHESIITRALRLFDEIIIAIGVNTKKESYFSLDTRLKMIHEVFKSEPRIKIDSYSGLTVDYCKKQGAQYLLRGLRTSSDFEYERAIAQLNKTMYPDIESVFFLTLPEHTPIQSTIVRDVIRYGGDASRFIPSAIDLSKYNSND